jgi:hypothetical protein
VPARVPTQSPGHSLAFSTIRHTRQTPKQRRSRNESAFGFATRSAYVVARGLTQMTVAGTTLGAGAVTLQPGSEPGVQAGRFGLICFVSVRVVVSM